MRLQAQDEPHRRGVGGEAEQVRPPKNTRRRTTLTLVASPMAEESRCVAEREERTRKRSARERGNDDLRAEHNAKGCRGERLHGAAGRADEELERGGGLDLEGDGEGWVEGAEAEVGAALGVRLEVDHHLLLRHLE